MQRLSYKGRVVRRRSLPSFSLVETAFPASAQLAEHFHDQAYISFLLRGSYTERGRLSAYDCAPGSMIFHPAGDEHSDSFDGTGGWLLNLQLNSNWLERSADQAGFHLGETTILRASCFRVGLELHAGLDSLSGEELDDLALELVASVSSVRQPSFRPKWFPDSLRMVEDCVQNHEPISLRETARRCGVHPVYLSRCFRRFSGTTFSRYLIQQRVRSAFRLLLETDAAIVDVALQCGFADHAHFCRAFRSATGLTPSAFRARFAAN